jgi:cytochrome oxidase assembly protein ShyY1
MSELGKPIKEPRSILKTLIALILIAGCLWASQWQFQRGIDRQDRNAIIESQLQLPAIELSETNDDFSKVEWRTVTTQGTFDSQKQILLKNRYFEGVYGYEVLTRFTSSDGRTFWVDRGWVKAGKDATTAPIVSTTPTEDVSIKARLRLDRSLPQGAFFALPSSGGGMISKLNAQTDSKSEGFYLDLLSGSVESLTPEVPAQVPELSDGPHLAYALQWIFFAGLVIYGRILIRRGQILTSKEL